MDPVHNTKTLIDHILTTRDTTRITAGTIAPPLADHLQTYAMFHKNPPRKKALLKPTLSLKRYEKLKETIDHEIEAKITESLTIHSPTTTSEELGLIQQAITSVIEKYERKPRPRRQKWCDPKFKRRIKRQHQLYEKRTKNPTPQNTNRHRAYRKSLRKDIILAKKEHITKLLEITKKDPKQQAKILKRLVTSKGQSRSSPTCIKYKEKIHTDPQEIADALNDNYITIGHRTSMTIPHQQEDSITAPRAKEHTPSFTLQPTNLGEVYSLLGTLNPNKASDIFKIKPVILKSLKDFIGPHLTRLFNKAISENQYPDTIKITKVIEIYKSDDPTLP